MAKQTKITKSARGEQCQIRIPGVCNFNPETTVYCHINGGGMGMKASDLHGAYGCSDCHAVLDGHMVTTAMKSYTSSELKIMHYEGMVRTQQILLEKGLIKI